MQIRCPYCTEIRDADAAVCCDARTDATVRLLKTAKSNTERRKRVWLWNAQHTVDWIRPDSFVGRRIYGNY